MIKYKKMKGGYRAVKRSIRRQSKRRRVAGKMKKTRRMRKR